MKMKHFISFLFLFLVVQIGYAQITFPRNGVYDDRDGIYAFKNATIHKAPGQVVNNATLVIKEGKIEAVGAGVSIPLGAIEIDLKGKHIYPSFIDIYADYGMPEVQKKEGSRNWGIQQMVSNKKGPYSWNEALRTEFRAHENFTADSKAAKGWIKVGFGTLSSHQMDGISRGSAALVSLADKNEHETILKDITAHHYSFKKGSSTQNYPGSLMGAIALLKQTNMDSDWYKNHGYKIEKNLSLQSWDELKSVPQIFTVGDKLEALRVLKMGEETKDKFIIKGSGDEYQRLEELKKWNPSFILPLNFPKAYDVEDPYNALLVSLGDMKHWELAPSNPGMLEKAGMEFAFTADGLKEKKDFLKNIQKAIKEGLSEDAALKALTTTPAKMINCANIVGTLEKGKIANFLITSGKIFAKKTKIHENWVMGLQTVLKPMDLPNLSGEYVLHYGNEKIPLKVKGADEPKIVLVKNDTTDIKVKHIYSNGLITLSFHPDEDKEELISLSGVVEDKMWSGRGTDNNGQWINWRAVFSKKLEPEKKEGKKDGAKKDESMPSKKEAEKGKVVYPFMAYGWETPPQQGTYLITNATVWTNEEDGILEEADVLISNGKIKKVGKGLSAGGGTEIDGTGKHVTCGLVDEHSHIAISKGVNECTQANTAEVSIADVVNSEDINIYRQLSGGVTTSQLLHGSCNPIGGRSALIKLRWGLQPEEMKMENTDGFIKFALGENVKKSRTDRNNRFPDSRMGVEQVYLDAFTRAREYKANASDPTRRKDLELEVVNEILDSKRFVTCHSYVQSEINMLMHVAEQFDFRINTFTHILEGYKVADKMQKHGAAGSSFSDWWAYKYEVIDAIPQNGEIMNNQGVLVGFNSDDAEMARRLNQEAAKAMMYGDISEEEAWKFVTLNPAKMLHIDDRVGSLKAGKDADVVLWSDHPLSIYAKAEMTFIDGIKYFDRAEDKKMHAAIQKERARLIGKMLAAKKGGAPTQGVKGKHHHHYHCDDHEDELRD